MSMFDLYDALIEAGASDAKARKAVDAVFAHKTSLAEPRLEANDIAARTDLARIKAQLRDLQATLARMFRTMLACFALQATITLAGFGWVLIKLP